MPSSANALFRKRALEKLTFFRRSFSNHALWLRQMSATLITTLFIHSNVGVNNKEPGLLMTWTYSNHSVRHWMLAQFYLYFFSAGVYSLVLVWFLGHFSSLSAIFSGNLIIYTHTVSDS